MKREIKTTALFLLSLILAGTGTLHSQQRQEKELKKGPNLSLNLTNPKYLPPKTYLNVGLLSNYASLNGLGINIVSSVVHFHSKGIQLSGLSNVTGFNVTGIQFSGIANVTGGSTKGLALTGLTNINGQSVRGLQFSLLTNFTGKQSQGAAISGLININGDKTTGVELAGLANVSGKSQKGVIASGLMNVAGDSLKGVQISSLLNVTATACNGAQMAALGNITVNNRGLQLGTANFASANKGLQLGLANISQENKKGVQIGVVNISQDSAAHQVGCINLTPHTRVQMLVSGGNANKFALAVRFKNRHTYTSIGAGTHYLDIDQKFSASAFYRAGLHYPLLPKLEISADAGYYHIETLKNKDKGYPARMYALQPRINVEYSIRRRLGIFLSGGYVWTRSYNRPKILSHKPTFEAGIVLF